MRIRFVLIGLCSVVFASVCSAEEQKAIEATASVIATQEPFNMTGSLVRMLGGFLFCLGVFGAGMHVYRKYVLPKSTTTRRRVRVLERLTITPKTSLILLSVDGREMLISAGPDQARLIQGPMLPTREMFEESIADLYSVPAEEKRCVG